MFYEMNYFFDSFDSFDFDYAVFSQTFNDPYSDQINNMSLIRESIGHTYQKAEWSRKVAETAIENKAV